MSRTWTIPRRPPGRGWNDARPATSSTNPTASTTTTLRAIADAQAAGLVRHGDPFDIMAMVIAMSMAWSPVSNVYAATAQEPQDLHTQRRALLHRSIRRAMTPE
ncbi:hypothetical protein [Nocardia jinanensis]|uniref:hypothetical protein n=1 Tax=Nocardia jinanensis TaxID=382504 RepID=UPI0018F8B844|nr:hypothetical protein [Nocardia jinanensis]